MRSTNQPVSSWGVAVTGLDSVGPEAPRSSMSDRRIVAKTVDSPLGRNLVEVWGVFDGQVASIFVDGICRADQHLAMRAAPDLIGVSIVPMIIVATALSGLAAAAMARTTRRRGRQLWLVCGGSSAWLFLFFAGCWEHLPHLDVPAVLVGVASLAAAAPLCTKFPGFQSTVSAPKQ